MSTTPKPFQLGTVSSGTMRMQDLIPALASECLRLDVADPVRGRGVIHLLEFTDPFPATTYDLVAHDEDDPYWQSEEALWDLDALFDALNNACPPFVYFGSNPGDGADYGFWPDMENLDNARRDAGEPSDIGRYIHDSGYMLLPDEDVWVHVNDHGNVAILTNDDGHPGHIIWDCV